MTMREHHQSTAKYINFTNGFPRKEVVPTQVISAGVNVHGGFFVGLHDGATSCLTKSQRTIPPLAKRRANAIALKPRASSSRYRKKRDPFSEHKGTEKTGFTPPSFKHSKPKIERNSPKTDHTVSNGTNEIVSKLRLSRPTETLSTFIPESSAMTRNPEYCNSRIFTDVEKKTTLNELIGIDEVYQRVCNGNMDSLHSLVSPVKPKKKIKNIPSMQYIQTSSPLSLKQKPTKTPSPVINGSEFESKAEEDVPHHSRARSQNFTRKMSKKQHTILLPLPYFPNPPKPPNTAPVYSKGSNNYPKVYPSRLEKHNSRVISSLSGWSSPSVINFSPVDLPDSKQPVSRACAPTGSIVGVQNKSQTGKVAIMASLDVTATPPATAECDVCQQGFEEGDDKNEIINGKWESPEVDSLYSEEQPESINTKIKQNNPDEDNDTENGVSQNSRAQNIPMNDMKGNFEDESGRALGLALSTILNVTDESGEVNEVEIYDPSKRDLEKEELVNREVVEAKQNYEKKIHDLESLLDEHEHLVQETNELSKELHN